MTIVGIGVDLVKISRIQEMTERWGPRFLDRVFTPTEQAYCLRRKFPPIHLSARFAVKEAILKALGTGLRMGTRWTEIETVNNPAGKPEVKLRGRTGELAAEKNVSEIFATITHDTDYSIAQVLLQGPQK
ncbi:MAG TPA: holo-ACP synthase [Candidatus Manganitrophaceae bacterium]|nr:holo-ACP synthase [Candidatus Manganitrophaceae bacterium]